MDETPGVENTKLSIKERLRSKAFLKTVAGIAGGVLLGYLYYYFIGCKSGSCAITGSPYGSMLFGGILGMYVTNSPCSKGAC